MKAIEVVSRETRERLALYTDLLHRWNTRIRLTGAYSSEGIAHAMRQSLCLVSFVPSRISSALDIGSGNGLPAVPLSISLGIPFTLVESDRRKAAFLQEVARETACPLTVAACRIEHHPVQPFDLITAQAFGSLSRLLSLAFPRQNASTVCLFPKGANVSAELAEAHRSWTFVDTGYPVEMGQIIEIHSISPKS